MSTATEPLVDQLSVALGQETHPAPETDTQHEERRRNRTYSVVAMSFPIVYSLEGDHDPNGLLYTLRVYKPLLQWAKRQWEADDEYLPKLHRQSQLMETVVHGLPRYQRMREILAAGPAEYRYLLGECGDEVDVVDRERTDRHRRRPDPRERAIRQNYRATVDQLVAALKELTRGRVTALPSDPDVLAEWRTQWSQQLADAERAIEHRLQQIDFGECVEEQHGSGEPPLSEAHIRRLMLNDHSPGAPYDPASPGPHLYDRFNPLKPFLLVRPLVLRACRGETVEVHFENEIRGRTVGLHVQGDSLAGGVVADDGAHVGSNASSLVEYGCDRTYTWQCTREGVWPVNDLGDVRGTDRGTNNHGLFGALVVEPAGARWYDPETGERLDDTEHPDGLYVDVVPPSEHHLKGEAASGGLGEAERACPAQGEHTCARGHRCRRWREENFVDFHHTDDQLPADEQAKDCSFREFAVFFHDETETHSGIPHPLPHSAMPLSYRAEPMHNRLPYRLYRRIRQQEGTAPNPDPKTHIDYSRVRVELDDLLGEVFWVARDLKEEIERKRAAEHVEPSQPVEFRDDADGIFLERVSGEEQHHSAWLFGESVTPILRAYKGDPCRVRLVHAGVKETHVYHLHVHQWRAVAHDTAAPSVWKPDEHHGSQLLDSISIGPQTGMTIDPLYGSGSRQHAVGDVIWHCHLYPHFHHGMWGLWRSFDRLVDGNRAYPDGTPCAALMPLPGREPDPASTERPGFPWFVDATHPRKSPPPPSPDPEDAPGQDIHVDGRRQLLRMGHCSPAERAAFAPGAKDNSQPGALFVDLDALARTWNQKAKVPEQRLLSYDITMSSRRLTYNSAGWHDPHGHHYALTGIRVTQLDDSGAPLSSEDFDPPAVRADGGVDAFFPRANHGDVVELRLHNTVGTVGPDQFDFPGHPVECGLHVHLVKFDVLAADGSASGWNYMSGASSPEAIGPNQAGESPRNVSLHRWVVDEEFGPCFFHDHLLANFRQKRGLFAALVAEPVGTRWYLPDRRTPAWVGTQAVVLPRRNGPAGIDEAFREACLAIGDFVPLHRRNGEGLNEPQQLGGDDDPGVMGVNYRCAPLEYRGKDPSEWFSSQRTAPDRGSDQPWLPGQDPADPGPVGRRRGFEGRRPLDVTDASPLLPVPSKEHGDPDTPVVYTYPGERLRIRVLQGSHEEQHSFMLNGLRWRREWHNPKAPLVNQQTLGISEAFTIDVDPRFSPYGPGDYLWQFTVLDDLWLGCWGLVRALLPSTANFAQLLPLSVPDSAPSGSSLDQALHWFQTSPRARSVPDPRPLETEVPHRQGAKVRPYTVVARRHEHLFAGHALTDPWGLIYRVVDEEAADDTKRDRVVDWDLRPQQPETKQRDADADSPAAGQQDAELSLKGNLRVIMHDDHDVPRHGKELEPLVLRAHPGEWIRIRLINEVLLPEDNGKGWSRLPTADRYLPPFGPEVSPPRVPEEHRNHLGYPDRRTVSPRVSLHPSLLRYDVVSDDGSYVGLNHDSTVAALDVDPTAHVAHGGHDGTDDVAHRTDHGIGHRDPNWRDYWWYADEQLAPQSHREGPGQVCYVFDMADIRNHRHHGLIGAIVVEPADVQPCDPTDPEQEVYSGPRALLRDRESGEVVAQEQVLFLQDGLRHFLRGDPDQPVPDVSPSDPPVDAGQKAISYRSPLTPAKNPLAAGGLPIPILEVPAGPDVWLRLVCAGDKPRNHTFTLHGYAWAAAPWVRPEPDAGAVGAIAAGFAQNLVLCRQKGSNGLQGDHCYRSGAFRWAVSQGMWGILRVMGNGNSQG